MKLIDFDGMFDEKLAEYIEANEGKYSEKQWESVIPKLYAKFGDTFIKSAGNTPKGYYAAMSDEELTETLVRHVKEAVPVSDFLCRELEKRDCPESLLRLLSSDDEQLLTLAVNTAGGNPKAFCAYLDIIAGDHDEEIKDTVADQIKSNADPAKEKALELYGKGIAPEYMLEILSRCSQKDDRVFDVLIKEFRTAPDEIPMHASYLAAYGDARALPVLLDSIAREDINYVEFQELKYAIEALGGEYTETRDFSDDPYYREVMEQSQMTPDFSEPPKTDA